VPTVEQEQLRSTVKRSVGVLNEAGVRFALGGSYALWAHGAHEPLHDVDLVLTEAEAERAFDVLEKAGFRTERPPEGWLYKAWDDDLLIDLLYQLNGRPVDDALIDTAEELQVLGVWMPVLPAQRIITTKLLAMNEHYCDFGAHLPAVRAVREQLDWDQLEQDTRENDFAVAFLLLARRLGIAP
jgi:hypothetical protein